MSENYHAEKNPSNKVMIGMSLTLLLISPVLVNLQQSFAQIDQTSPIVQSQRTDCATTEPTIQGPEYKLDPPFREGLDFAKGLEGPRLELSGIVLNRECNPVNGAVLDIWQADSKGKYDMDGFNLRGKIKTDKDGKYVLDTIYPKGSTSRPSHIHLMIAIPGQPVLTTQVYFEGQPRDSAVKDSLITNVTEMQGIKAAHFDFIIEDYRDRK